MEDCRFRIVRRTYFNFLMLRIRAKISYIAFMKRQTLVELIATQCFRSYIQLSESRSIPKTQPYSK